MKFVKSKFAQKLIITLVVLMIFNVLIPKEIHAAWDVGGILFKPITAVILSIIVPIDTTIGLILNGGSIRNKSIRGVNRNDNRCYTKRSSRFNRCRARS